MKLTSLALAGVLALGAAGASLAQPAPAPAPGAPRPADGQRWQRPDPAQMAQRRAERLRAVLQLRPDQESALQALIAAMRPSPEQMQRRQAERAEMQNLTTPQRLDRMQARMTERQAEFAKRADAIKRFYAQLNPAQQRAFDAMRQGMGQEGMGHEGMGGRGGMHGPGGMGHGTGPIGPGKPPGGN